VPAPIIPSCPEVLVLRHGQTEWNAEGRLQGHLDSPLTEKGLRQAQRQNEILQPYDLTGFRFISSPQGRAHMTAQIALAGLAAEIETSTGVDGNRHGGLGLEPPALRLQPNESAAFMTSGKRSFMTGPLVGKALRGFTTAALHSWPSLLGRRFWSPMG
jgi:hypothetical protein